MIIAAMMITVPRGGAVRLARLAHNQQVAGSNPAPRNQGKPPTIGGGFTFFILVYYAIVWYNSL